MPASTETATHGQTAERVQPYAVLEQPRYEVRRPVVELGAGAAAQRSADERGLEVAAIGAPEAKAQEHRYGTQQPGGVGEMAAQEPQHVGNEGVTPRDGAVEVEDGEAAPCTGARAGGSCLRVRGWTAKTSFALKPYFW